MSQANNPKTSAPNAARAGQIAEDAKKKALSAQTKEARAPKEPKVDPVLAKKVKILVEKNPKRESSKSHARFALYAEGQTAEAYVEKCVAAGSLRRAARADLDWDVKHKFVELV